MVGRGERRQMCRLLMLLALTLVLRTGLPAHLAPPSLRGRAHGRTSLLARRSVADGPRLSVVDPQGSPSKRPASPAAAGSARRAVTLGCAAALAAFVASQAAPARAATSELDVYFGAGNFFSMQHELVMKEALDLGRREGDITALSGYAGGKKAGDLERLCYNGLLGAPDHVSLGHAQVVRVTIPSKKLPDFTRTFLDQIAQRRQREQGSQFRAVIGLRGGMESKFYPLIQEACEGKVELVKGQGNEPDNYDKGIVYVYDARKFPWRPAEANNQFRDDPPTYYERDYKEIYEKQKRLGIILRTGCPGE